MIDEKRLGTPYHRPLYQQRMAQAFNKKVRLKSFREGDLVLKKVFPNILDPRGKFTPSYKESYFVKKVLLGGALILAHMDGLSLRDPINADAIKMYYV